MEEANKCFFCGKRLEYLPYTCKYCGESYCSEHRLPERHYCEGLAKWKRGELKKFKKPIRTITTTKPFFEPHDWMKEIRSRYSVKTKFRRSDWGLKRIVKYFIIFYIIFTYLFFIGVFSDLSRAIPKSSQIISKLEKFSLLPPRNETEIEQTVFQMTNNERMNVGVYPLSYNQELSILAKEHSEDMIKRGYFSHDTPEGLSPTDRALKKGIYVTKDYGFYYQVGIGENIMDMPITIIPFFITVPDCFIVLTNHQIVQCSFDGWKKSSGHYSNMINPSYTEIGIGVYCNFLGCKLTQDFR